MLTQESQKKLTNVSVITLKKFGRKYELALFPNKLIEFRHNPSTPLSTILHSNCIFRSVATGDIASAADVALLGDRDAAIMAILEQGHEQKATATSLHELEATEREILELIQGKVVYNGTFLSKENLIEMIRSVWNVKPGDAKRQVSGIIKKLEEVGFERVSFAVNVEGETVVVKSDVLPDFIEECERAGKKYVINRHNEAESEDIC